MTLTYTFGVIVAAAGFATGIIFPSLLLCLALFWHECAGVENAQ